MTAGNHNIGVGECVNIFLPQNKAEKFWDIITGEGYEKSAEGVLKFVMESEFIEDEDHSEKGSSKEAINDWIHSHPDEWQAIKKKGANVIGSLMTKIAKSI